MEADQGQDSKGSSEETSPPIVLNEDFGHGQLYECMFCKRGFSTAQALGGHMNIHRRDRARMRQQIPPPSPYRSNEDPTATAFRTQIPSNQSNYIPPVLETSRNHHIYRLTHSSSTRHPQTSRSNDVSDTLNSQHLDRYNSDLCLRLGNLADHRGLWIGEEQNVQDEEEGELDLELRLGHDP